MLELFLSLIPLCDLTAVQESEHTHTRRSGLVEFLDFEGTFQVLSAHSLVELSKKVTPVMDRFLNVMCACMRACVLACVLKVSAYLIRI